MLAPTAYLRAAYIANTHGAIACGPEIGCVHLESTNYTKRAAWLPGPDRLPHEAAESPFRFLLWGSSSNDDL